MALLNFLKLSTGVGATTGFVFGYQDAHRRYDFTPLWIKESKFMYSQSTNPSYFRLQHCIKEGFIGGMVGIVMFPTFPIWAPFYLYSCRKIPRKNKP